MNNRYLEKIASTLPYRQRAEILIHKDGKVLITVNRDGDRVWHGLPGGGIEDNQSPDLAAEKEALEEVGVAVKNVRHSGHTTTKEGMMTRPGKEGRALQYRGTTTHLYEADFDKEDSSMLGKDGDATHYKWMTPEEAYLISQINHAETGEGMHRLKALEKYLP